MFENQLKNSALVDLLVEKEREVLDDWISEIFGYELICAGSLCENLSDTISNSPISGKSWLCTDTYNSANGLKQIRGDLENFPITSDAIDLVILPHTLDSIHNPQRLMREVDRVLIPEGRIIISGLNPWSLWGAYRSFGGGRHFSWPGKAITLAKLRDWLGLLGFEVERHEILMYRPPLAAERYCLLDTLGPRFWPGLGAVYMVQAVKRVSTLTPIKQRWKLTKNVIRVEPVNRATRDMNE